MFVRIVYQTNNLGLGNCRLGKKGKYYITDTFSDTEILGWMIQTEDDTHSLPVPHLPPNLMAIHGAAVAKQGQFKKRWLNKKMYWKKPICRPQDLRCIPKKCIIITQSLKVLNKN